jgi:hypothetical protein
MKNPLPALSILTLLAVLGCGSSEPPPEDGNRTAGSGSGETGEAALSMPPGTATGWVQMAGERTELSHAAALRVEVCPGDFANFVVLTDRPVDLAEYVVPLTPPLDVRTGIDNLFRGGDEGTFVVLSERIDKPYLEVGRMGPGGVDGFNGPAVLADIRPEIRVDTEEVIEGGWEGKTDGQNWVGGPATWDFEFAAEVSDFWLAGEELPAHGGPPGDIVRSYVEASPAGDFPDGAEIVGGRSNGERAMVGWRAPNGGEGFFFLESEAPVEDGGAPDWRIVAKVPCIRLG